MSPGSTNRGQSIGIGLFFIGLIVAALVFGGLDMLQIQLQTAGISVPNRLVNLFPYAGVIVVLTVWGTTRTPSAVGESYESEE